MSTKGGKRPGAGRKKGNPNKKTIEKRMQEAEARAHMIAFFSKKWRKIEKSMYETAVGKIKVTEVRGKMVRVYEKPPSEKMLQVIAEIVIGKPQQPISGSLDMPALTALSNDIRAILSKNPEAPTKKP